MALRTYKNNAWEDIADLQLPEVNGVREQAPQVNAYLNESWEEVWTNAFKIVNNQVMTMEWEIIDFGSPEDSCHSLSEVDTTIYGNAIPCVSPGAVGESGPYFYYKGLSITLEFEEPITQLYIDGYMDVAMASTVNPMYISYLDGGITDYFTIGEDIGPMIQSCTGNFAPHWITLTKPTARITLGFNFTNSMSQSEITEMANEYGITTYIPYTPGVFFKALQLNDLWFK